MRDDVIFCTILRKMSGQDSGSIDYSIKHSKIKNLSRGDMLELVKVAESLFEAISEYIDSPVCVTCGTPTPCNPTYTCRCELERGYVCVEHRKSGIRGWVVVDNRHAPDMLMGSVVYSDPNEALVEAERQRRDRGCEAFPKSIEARELYII